MNDSGPRDWWHGTAGGYVNHRCRCPRCTKANTARNKRTRAALRKRPRSHVPHGTLTGYNNWGCHCPACREVNAEAQRRYQAKRKAAAP